MLFSPLSLTATLALALSCLTHGQEAGSDRKFDPVEIGPFGIGSCYINGRSAQDNARWIPQMREIGLKYLRAGYMSWHDVEPRQGEFQWTALDAQLDYLESQGMITGGLLLGNPGWNKEDPPGHLPSRNLAGWSRYVGAVVSHTKGRIGRWEIWNEPPNFTGKDQTPGDYAKIVAAAYQAAKAADPDCLVGLAAKSAHISYLAQVIDAGAKDHFDYITLHPYEILNGVVDDIGAEPVFMNIVTSVRRMLAAKNPEKIRAPVIFTELGVDAGGKGAEKQAHGLVKAYVMSLAQGVQCVQWFEGRDGDSGPMGLLDAEGKPRPAYTALGQMIRVLGQKPVLLGWVDLGQGSRGFLFQGAEGEVLAAWARRGKADTLETGEGAVVLDPFTGQEAQVNSLTLTSAPVFILKPGPELVSQAKANLDKPMNWDGDFSKAETVSITTQGADIIEKGLRSLSTDSLAKAVTAYGGSARAGNIPGGNVFVVDPGFMTYDQVPLEVTVVVRRNEANDNAGFKLVYESPEGFKTAGGWNTIPDNKEWHTFTFRIDDPCFVNYWGYNFCLESDGNEYNKYYLQSLTVKKLSR